MQLPPPNVFQNIFISKPIFIIIRINAVELALDVLKWKLSVSILKTITCIFYTFINTFINCFLNLNCCTETRFIYIGLTETKYLDMNGLKTLRGRRLYSEKVLESLTVSLSSLT